MKKIDYQAPEMEVVELDYQKPLLDASSGETEKVVIPTDGSDEPNLD